MVTAVTAAAALALASAFACGSVEGTEASSPDGGEARDADAGRPGADAERAGADAEPDAERDAGARDDAADPDFSLSPPDERVDVRVQAATEVEIALDRRGGFDAAVAVSAIGLPEGVSAEPITIPADADAGTITIEASESAAAGDRVAVTLEASGGDATRTANVDLFLVGRAGTLDASFGDGGVRAVASQVRGLSRLAGLGDGSLVGAGVDSGRLFAAKFLADGGLDPDFGDGGVASADVEPLGIEAPEVADVVVQPGGTIVLVGHGDGDPDPEVEDRDLVLARFSASGALDTAFAGGGRVDHPIGAADAIALDAAAMADGRIAVVGTHQAPEAGRDSLLAVRFTADGSLDASFAGDGVQTARPTTDRNSESWLRAAVAVEEDGGLVAMALRIFGIGGREPVVWRLRPDGSPDADMGTNGVAVLEFGSFLTASGIRPLAEGGLLLAGAESFEAAFFRIDDRGALDEQFGDGGFVHVSASDESIAFASLLVAGGRPIALGTTGRPSLLAARLADLTSSALDPSFGSGGVTTEPALDDPRFHDAALRTDYRLVALVRDPDGDPAASRLIQYWY